MAKKTLFVAFIAIFAVFASIALSSAWYYYDYQSPSNTDVQSQHTSYQAPEVKIVYPSYSYGPTTTSSSSSFNNDASQYSSIHQGPSYDATHTYVSFVLQDGYFAATKEVQTQRYIGEYDNVNSASHSSSGESNNYQQSSPQPSSYDGGSLWRYSPRYDSSSYSSSVNYQDYYYNPRYDSNRGYYNWRY